MSQFNYTSLGKSAVKLELHNPFYGCPIYEDVVEHFNSQSQHPSSEVTTSSNANLYESIPINIEGTQTRNGQESHHIAGISHMNGENAAGVESDMEGEEVYIVMHTPLEMSITSNRNNIHTSMSMPESCRRE